MTDRDPFAGLTDEELETAPTLDGGGRVWSEFWPLGPPDHFKVAERA